MKDYRSPLTTLDLLAVARAHPVLSRYHAGTYPLDALSQLTVSGRPRHLIYNASPSTSPGSHWISMWLAPDLSIEVMDSLGQRPTSTHVMDFLRRHANRATYLSRRVQDLGGSSNACGLYCLSHGIARARGETLTTWLAQFSDCTPDNDRRMNCEFMRDLAIPTLFVPRLRNWQRALRQACRPVRCRVSSDTASKETRWSHRRKKVRSSR